MGKKEHRCSICDSTFTEKYTLKRHILSRHEKIKSNKCTSCESSFSTKRNLKQHIELVHEG